MEVVGSGGKWWEVEDGEGIEGVEGVEGDVDSEYGLHSRDKRRLK